MFRRSRAVVSTSIYLKNIIPQFIFTCALFSVMFFVCIGIVLVVGSVAWTSVLVFGNMAQRTILR